MDLDALHQSIVQARTRIQDHVRNTPLEFSPYLSNLTQGKVYIKLESEQVTGSFKARGAFNKVCLLCERDPTIKAKGPVTSSTGNHALACNYAMKKMGISGTIFVPETINAAKEEALTIFGVEFTKHGQDCVDGEVHGRKTAQEQGRVYISPYNDLDIVAGQGTIGMEIYEDLPNLDVVFVSVGGGGLIAGIAAYLKFKNNKIKIIGCQPERSKVMYESIKSGKVIYEESSDTLSDGTAGGVEEDCVTFPLCRDYVDEWVMVTEEEIGRVLYFMMDKHHKIVEGAAGVALAAFVKSADRYKHQTAAIVSCGANIGMDKIKDIIAKYG